MSVEQALRRREGHLLCRPWILAIAVVVVVGEEERKRPIFAGAKLPIASSTEAYLKRTRAGPRHNIPCRSLTICYSTNQTHRYCLASGRWLDNRSAKDCNVHFHLVVSSLHRVCTIISIA